MIVIIHVNFIYESPLRLLSQISVTHMIHYLYTVMRVRCLRRVNHINPQKLLAHLLFIY